MFKRFRPGNVWHQVFIRDRDQKTGLWNIYCLLSESQEGMVSTRYLPIKYKIKCWNVEQIILEFENILLSLNFRAEMYEALLWDIFPNSISGWVDLLMESSWWVTASVQVRENDRAKSFTHFSKGVYCACDILCGHLCVVSEGVFQLADPPMWVQMLHRNKAVAMGALTPSHESEKGRNWAKSVGIPTLCFWLIHKHNLGLASHPHTHAPIHSKWSLSCSLFETYSVSPVFCWQTVKTPNQQRVFFLSPLSVVCQPPHLKFKKFHREIVTELERKTDMDVKYMTVSSLCVHVCAC